MELTYYSDYGLRVLIYAATQPDRRCLIRQIAEHYGVSRNHLTKVVHGLARGGLVATYRGRGGGLTLSKPPEEISLGAVVRHMEGPIRPVECYRSGNRCSITGVCVLPGILEEAFNNFLGTLDRYTLADLLRHRAEITRRLTAPKRRGRGRKQSIVLPPIRGA